MRYINIFIALSSFQLMTFSAVAQEGIDGSVKHKSNYKNDKMSGPGSTLGQLDEDDIDKDPAFRFAAFDSGLASWFDFKENLYKEHGVQLGVAYTSLYQNINESMSNHDDAASHIIRINGKWELFNRAEKNQGYLVFSADNRNAYTDVAPNSLAGEAGYLGQSGLLFADFGTVLGDLYWAQYFNDGKSAFVAGRYDPNDFFDVLGYASPWVAFQNLAVVLNTSIGLPDWSTGIGVGHWFENNWYVKGAMNDANGLATDSSFTMDFDELYKTVEFGWSPSADLRYHANIHVTYWHVDERVEAGIDEASGFTVGANWTWDDQIMLFSRLGFSDVDAANDPQLAEQTVTLGAMYKFKYRSDLFGVAINHSKMAIQGVEDQITTEIFYRIQLAENLSVTPSFQYLKKPALNSEVDNVTLFGLRLRITL